LTFVVGQPLSIFKLWTFFLRLVGENIMLMSQALSRKLVIPEFPEFCERLKHVFYKCKKNKDGKVSKKIFNLNGQKRSQKLGSVGRRSFISAP